MFAESLRTFGRPRSAPCERSMPRPRRAERREVARTCSPRRSRHRARARRRAISEQAVRMIARPGSQIEARLRGQRTVDELEVHPDVAVVDDPLMRQPTLAAPPPACVRESPTSDDAVGMTCGDPEALHTLRLAAVRDRRRRRSSPRPRRHRRAPASSSATARAGRRRAEELAFLDRRRPRVASARRSSPPARPSRHDRCTSSGSATRPPGRAARRAKQPDRAASSARSTATSRPDARRACSGCATLAFTTDPALVALLHARRCCSSPTANPDGRAANTRENSDGTDINRDHLNLAIAEAHAIGARRPRLAARRADRPARVRPGEPVLYDDDLLYLWPRNLNVDAAGARRSQVARASTTSRRGPSGGLHRRRVRPSTPSATRTSRRRRATATRASCATPRDCGTPSGILVETAST